MLLLGWLGFRRLGSHPSDFCLVAKQLARNERTHAMLISIAKSASGCLEDIGYRLATLSKRRMAEFRA
jgi:hypothetical protein